MGRMIARKVKGMNWKAKISLVLIFTLVFSTFMYQGWQAPKKTEAAADQLILLWDGSGSLPSGWTDRSASGQVFYQRYLRGAATAGTNGGNATHTHTQGTHTVANSGANNEGRPGTGTNNTYAVDVHSHTSPSVSSIGTANNLPPYRNLRVIQYTGGGMPATLPAGVIALFDVAVPSGWTRYSGQDGSYIRGEAAGVVTNTGGSTSHTHALTVGSTGGADTTLQRSNATGGTNTNFVLSTHTHTVSATDSGTTYEPAHTDVIMGKLDADGPIPSGMIGFFDATPLPTYWSSISGAGGAFENRLIKGSATYTAPGGGGGTHTLGPITVTSGQANTSVTRNASSTGSDLAIDTHTHSATLNFNTATEAAADPPYRTVIVAKYVRPVIVTATNLQDYPAPANTNQGNTGVAMLKFQLSSDWSSATWTGGKLDKIGTNVNLGDVTYDIYADANGNGTFELSDTAILSGETFSAATGDTYTLASPQTIDTTPKWFFIVYNIDNAATIGTTVGARIANDATYFTLTGGTMTAPTATSSTASNILAGVCAPAAPTVSFLPASASLVQSSSRNYSVVVTNNDNIFCSNTTFSVAQDSEEKDPPGNTSFTATTYNGSWPLSTASLAPGASGTLTDAFTVNTAATITSGDRLTVSVTASAAAHGSATASVTTRAVVWTDSDMLHNWLRFACTVPGISDSTACTTAGGTWRTARRWTNEWGTATAGAQYGAILCGTCHTASTPNIKRIKQSIASQSGSFPGQTGGVTIGLSDARWGSADFASSTASTHTSSTRICEYCHGGAGIDVAKKVKSYNYNQSPAECHQSIAANMDCILCHEHKNGFRTDGTCISCHKIQQGGRASIYDQFSANSHHVQRGTPVKDTDCYQCHWEANDQGLVDTAYHGGCASPGAAVDLVIYGTTSRPGTYTPGTTAIQYTASLKTRAEYAKINTHCLGCHDTDSDTAQPFGDGKTPKQYAWDSTSIANRYTQSGTTTWGKYTGSTNAATKNLTKAYSAHGNAGNNARGWNTTTGYDTTPPNTSSNVNVLCYDCHNSHGSSASGVTTSYAAGTNVTNGGILKNTKNGTGGYTVDYTPTANPTTDNTASGRVKHSAGADLCFDCHMTASAAGGTPWSYDGTFGATQMIISYFEKPGWSGTVGVKPAGAQQRYTYKNLIGSKGGHFEASSALTHANAPATSTINGLCTPCHDPHGVSTTLTTNQQYAVPLLKGTWLTSPYKEDAAPLATNEQRGGSQRSGRQSPYAGSSTPGWHLDQNTFEAIGTSTWTSADYVWPGTTKISQTQAQFAGLCLSCHAQADINPNSSTTWQSMDRIHNTVKGWGGVGGNASNAIHSFSCSKCHTAHNSCLPRLMITNCIDYKHRGRVASTGTPGSFSGSDSRGQGQGRFPAGGGGNTSSNASCRSTVASGSGIGPWFAGNGGATNSSTTLPALVQCHNVSGAGGTTHPSSQLWNSKTPW